VRTIRTPGNFRLYHTGDVQRLFTNKEGETLAEQTQQQKKSYIYARVSSAHQKEDLERQIQDLQTAYPRHELIHDIGSGLNYKRKGFQRLLELVHQGSVREIVVAHKDRLCRYGVELLEWLFDKSGTKLVVHNQNYPEADNENTTRELADDLLAVCNFFVARNNGRRAADNKKRRRQQTEASSGQGQEDPSLPDKRAKADSQQLARDGQVDL